MKRNNFKYRNYIEMDTINASLRADASGFVSHCESQYYLSVSQTAQYIADTIDTAGIVLLAGPSSSGKTTTSHILTETLSGFGIPCRTVSMDDYFVTLDQTDREIDYEAPERLDIDMLKNDLLVLASGGQIRLPHFDFTTGIQTMTDDIVSRPAGSVVIFEGLHALSELFDEVGQAVRIYVSQRMRVTRGGEVFTTPEQLRFMRRCSRDVRFRGRDFAGTLSLWPNVIRGEKRYVLPSKENADIQIDTSMAYEPGLLFRATGAQLYDLDREEMEKAGLGDLAEKAQEFQKVAFDLIPGNSLMREFIGSEGLAK